MYDAYENGKLSYKSIDYSNELLGFLSNNIY